MARLTVSSTHDYRNDTLSDITEIHWTLNWHATFAPSQFDDVQIASNVQLSQSTATQLEMRIVWSSPTGFSAGNWTFAGVWPSDAVIRFQGSTGADIVVGSAKKDFFEVSGADILSGGAGDDTFFWVGPVVPGMRIDGGAGGDRLLFNGHIDFSSVTLNNVEVVDFSRASHGSATFTAAQFAAFTAVTGFHFFEPIFQEHHYGGSESLIINGASVNLSNVFFSGWHVTDNVFINGTVGVDTLTGSMVRDVINGGLGGDALNGGADDDTLNGGLNADSMTGGSGNDRYFVDNGGDVAVENAGEGLDTIVAFLDHTIEDHVENMILENGNFGTGNAENNRIDGHGGRNTLSDRGGNDQLFGYGGNDTLDGGDGADLLNGGVDADAMLGGAGNDRHVVDNASDVVTENAGEGLDTVQAFLNYTLAVNVENLNLESGVSGAGNAEHNRNANGGDNTLSGLGGNDQLFGYSGNDTLDGGVNADTMRDGTGNDRYFLDNGGDVVIENAGEGLDTIVAFLDHTIENNVENMILEGGVLGTGNAEHNRIDGHGGNNTLSGRAGRDLLLGHSGNDTLEGGADDDTFMFTNGTGNDTITDMQGGAGAGDLIDIRNFGFASFAAVMAATTDVSGGARIQLDGDDALLVQNMAKAQFDSNDFLLA